MQNTTYHFDRQKPYPPLLISLPRKKIAFSRMPKSVKAILGVVAVAYCASVFVSAEKTQDQLAREMKTAAERHEMIKRVSAEAARENTYYNVAADTLSEEVKEQQLFLEAAAMLKAAEMKKTSIRGNFRR